MSYKIKNVRVAQSVPTQQTMPKDVVEEVEVDLEIPRDESVGLDEVPLPPKTKKIEVYHYPYALGDGGSDTNIVPRDPSGDGLGGEKVSFETEKGESQTSGNPDNYVQTLNEVPAPKPAGSKENHAVANANNSLTKIATLENKLKEANRKIQKLETYREREKVAHKIVQAEIDRGFFAFASDDDFDKRVAELAETTPVSSLHRELERVRLLPSVAASNAAQITANASVNRKSGFKDHGSFALQSGIAALNSGSDPYFIDIRTASRSSQNQIIKEVINNDTTLGRNLPRE